MLLAVFDLGSNSFKLTVAQYLGQSSRIPFKIVHKERHPVQFGGSVFDTNTISGRHKVLGLKALQRMKDSLANFEVPLVRIVGTSAIREAKNGKQFVKEVSKKIGIDINVISGEEEAGIIAQGLEWEFPFVDQGLLVDIGGGSTEVACFGPGWKRLKQDSFEIGSVRLALDWEQNKQDPDIQMALRDRVQYVLKGKKVPKGFEYLVGSAGTMQSLAGILANKKKNILIKKSDLDAWIDENIRADKDLLQSKYKLTPSRARVVVPGAIILSESLNWLDEDEIFVTEMTLRNGLLVAMVEELRKAGWILDS